LKDLIERKRKAKGRKVIEEEEEPSGRGASNVVDLMAALKKSLDKPSATPAQKRSVTTTKKTAAKKSPARAAPAKKAARKRA
jgi:DNA end-binding protein Ku